MEPPADVQARLDKLDEALFGEGAAPGRVFLNPLTYADVRLWRGQNADPPYHRIDIESQAARLKMGLVAVLVTHGPEADPRQLWASRLVPVGFIYITDEGYGPLKEAPSEDRLISLEGA
jgi:hypothetical protein